MSKNRSFLGVIVLVVISLVLGFMIGKHYRSMESQYKILRASQNKIEEVFGIIMDSYVDTVDVARVTESVVESLVNELDPHSSYIPAADVEASNEDLEASFGGIGVTFEMSHDTILIVSVISGGPAEKAGLLTFDRIITINDSVVAGQDIGFENIRKMLRGQKHTKVMLGIQRGDATELTNFELIRGDIPNTTVDVAYIASDNIGYVKVSRFARKTYDEFLTAVAKLQKEGATGLIVDMRNNPGGIMETAYNMANEFLQKNRMIVYMQGRAYPHYALKANGKGTWQDMPLIVLINELSASASEIFAGAIQDNDRGTLIGRRSFGKGLVQNRFDLSDESEMLLTIARYYTPSGRCIQKSYELGKSHEYNLEVYKRNNELLTSDSIKINEALIYKTYGGRTVYGGGAIIPDIFVPLDTTGITSYYKKVINTGVLYLFVLEYSDRNHDKLKSFKTYKELYAYLKTQPLISEFTDFAASKGIPKRTTFINISKNMMETEICAYIVKNFFNNEGFYPVFQKDDETLNKAVSIMKEGKWKPEI